jgi:hypothetical protein
VLNENAHLMRKLSLAGQMSLSNKYFSSCKHDLIFILKQLSPHGNDLLEIIKELPEGLPEHDHMNVGALSGYVISTQSIVNKVLDGQLSFGLKPFEPNKYSNKIFIVHGHDINMLQAVDSFLIKVGLEPIILHEQP